MGEEHDHSAYHQERIQGNLQALEDHLRSQPCKECSDKHAVNISSYLEEEASTNPNANREELLALADRVREIRRRIQELSNMKHTSEQQKLQTTV